MIQRRAGMGMFCIGGILCWMVTACTVGVLVGNSNEDSPDEKPHECWRTRIGLAPGTVNNQTAIADDAMLLDLQLTSISAYPDGSVLVTGMTQPNVDSIVLDSQNGVTKALQLNDSRHFVARYDSQARLQWTRTPQSAITGAHIIADEGALLEMLTSDASDDRLIKLDAAGNIEWTLPQPVPADAALQKRWHVVQSRILEDRIAVVETFFDAVTLTDAAGNEFVVTSNGTDRLNADLALYDYNGVLKSHRVLTENAYPVDFDLRGDGRMAMLSILDVDSSEWQLELQYFQPDGSIAWEQTLPAAPLGLNSNTAIEINDPRLPELTMTVDGDVMLASNQIGDLLLPDTGEGVYVSSPDILELDSDPPIWLSSFFVAKYGADGFISLSAQFTGSSKSIGGLLQSTRQLPDRELMLFSKNYDTPDNFINFIIYESHGQRILFPPLPLPKSTLEGIALFDYNRWRQQLTLGVQNASSSSWEIIRVCSY
ncbi:MAG: hypothetical protein JXR76_05785 [Deltaproteobacteria bacterium]|nr:hypothetical protein [Deltaproteobacteria bacterium]